MLRFFYLICTDYVFLENNKGLSAQHPFSATSSSGSPKYIFGTPTVEQPGGQEELDTPTFYARPPSIRAVPSPRPSHHSRNGRLTQTGWSA